MTASWTGARSASPVQPPVGFGLSPSRHQGVALRSQGDPVLYLSDPAGVSPANRRRMLESLTRLNHRTLQEIGDPETQTRIDQYEMAFRMQSSVPELIDLKSETQQVLEAYGPDINKPGTFAYSCLMARRLVERGVRFVQIFHRGWDQHLNVAGDLPNQCRDVDQPCYAPDSGSQTTWPLGGYPRRVGRRVRGTIYCQGEMTRENYGRDHHPRCFTVWMAGGGIQPGVVYGETDEFGYNIVENPVHIHDMNATILHCLGIDHRRLSYKFQGLDVRLTGVEEHAPVPACWLKERRQAARPKSPDRKTAVEKKQAAFAVDIGRFCGTNRRELCVWRGVLLET